MTTCTRWCDRQVITCGRNRYTKFHSFYSLCTISSCKSIRMLLLPPSSTSLPLIDTFVDAAHWPHIDYPTKVGLLLLLLRFVHLFKVKPTSLAAVCVWCWRKRVWEWAEIIGCCVRQRRRHVYKCANVSAIRHYEFPHSYSRNVISIDGIDSLLRCQHRRDFGCFSMPINFIYNVYE